MAVDIITKEDLELFRRRLLDDFKEVVNGLNSNNKEDLEGYKTQHVRKILGCSTNKLQSLRISGKLRFKKVGGTVYYNKEDVKRLVEGEF